MWVGSSRDCVRKLSEASLLTGQKGLAPLSDLVAVTRQTTSKTKPHDDPAHVYSERQSYKPP